MTVRHDGRPTISDPRSDSHCKPHIVEERIEADVNQLQVTPEEMFAYAAWRSYVALREGLDESIQTREQFLGVLDALSATYEGLYRACSTA